MKKIKLTRGQYALVDDADFEYLSQWKWYATFDGTAGGFYAMRADLSGPPPPPPKSRTRVLMHRAILDVPLGKFVDHINGNTLDNRRENLRLATNQQNQINSKMRKNNTSGFKGVSWCKKTGKWRARIRHEGVQKLLGFFDNKEDAAKEHDKMARQFYGEFARPQGFPLQAELTLLKNER